MTKKTSTTDLLKYNFKRNEEKAAYALKPVFPKNYTYELT